MKKKALLLLSFNLILFFSACAQKAAESQGTRRPNIIFMMADDHAYQAISAYSDHLIQTPNIDRLAREGMLFTNACVTNSICAPSRATILRACLEVVLLKRKSQILGSHEGIFLPHSSATGQKNGKVRFQKLGFAAKMTTSKHALTGKHTHIHGKIDNNFPFDTTNVTFPQLLQEAGYQTAMFGKLHFGNSPKGFDEFMILPGQGHYYSPDFITNKGDTTIEGYVTDIITDLTIGWLDKRRDTEKPFLLMYLHKAPHREWFPAERHYREYIHKNFPEPPTLFDDYQGRGTAAKTAEMNLLKHMNWAGDSKIYPEVMDSLGIAETLSWGKQALAENLARMTKAQRKAWDEVYGPMNENFLARYPEMGDRALMQWRYQRYMQDYRSRETLSRCGVTCKSLTCEGSHASLETCVLSRIASYRRSRTGRKC